MHGVRNSEPSIERRRLARMLQPRSVAIVGVSENQPRMRNALKYLRDSDIDLYLVNPNRDHAFGLPTHPSLTAIGRPVDAVFVAVGAAIAVEVVAEAARNEAGGVVVNAGGFAEAGKTGVDLQRRLVEAAGPMPILGPNCNGFIDVNRGVRLSGAPALPIKEGSVAFVTHSGALMASMGAAGYERGIGFSHLISTGNEVAVDMADCLEFLIDDPNTRAICLVIESIRRPQSFFAAARRALAANKPILALKLGRSERGRAIASSHTGAIAGESWTYDAAFRQHGIGIARDLTELADRAICFDQLPSGRWSALDGLAILTASGGGAGMAVDYCAHLGMALPSLDGVSEEIRRLLPGIRVINPLDMTGFVVGDPEVSRKILDVYAASPDVDTMLLQWFVADEGIDMGSAFLHAFEDLSATTSKSIMLGSVEDGPPGTWASALPAKGIAVTRGLPSTLRSLQSMGDFVRFRRDKEDDAVHAVKDRIGAPDADDWIASDAGAILSFPATMRLLAGAGFDVAPFQIIDRDAAPATGDIGFPSPFVVKLANIPHRTELGAVRLGVSRGEIEDVVRDLRALADARGLPSAVVIQPQFKFHEAGQMFVGVNSSDLGPVVVCGLGGIFVELLKQVVGAVAPLSQRDIGRILEELDRFGVFQGIRGAPRWQRDRVVEALIAANRLALGARGWMASLDVNPLGFVGDRAVAVDALCIRNPE